MRHNARELKWPLDGRVLQTAAGRFGLTYNSYEPMLVSQPGFGTFRVHNKGRFPGEELYGPEPTDRSAARRDIGASYREHDRISV